MGGQSLQIGPRTIKTGLAVILALIISNLFNLSPILPAISAATTLLPSVYQTWKQFLEEAEANLIGAFLTLVSLWILGDNPANPLAIGIVIMAAISILLAFGFGRTIPHVVLMIIVILESVEGATDPLWQIVLIRYLLVMLGIGCALGVNALIFPPRYGNVYYQKASKLFEKLLVVTRAIAFEGKVTPYRSAIDKMGRLMLETKTLFNLHREEIRGSRQRHVSLLRNLIILQHMQSCLERGVATAERFREREKALNSIADELRSELFYHLMHIAQRQEKVLLTYDLLLTEEPLAMEDLVKENIAFVKHSFLDRDELEEEIIMEILPIVVAMNEWIQELELFEKRLNGALRRHVTSLSIEQKSVRDKTFNRFKRKKAIDESQK
ncbi:MULTISPECIES: FUSC family protein [Exiguobacterium]|uniref:Membrane protein-like protein n=1 Tax=Exiguobacterium sibiricum (strain DSM 17290 / CCUG 55495 / CIP 109462 / JCM 13490 / 255-15) TaxID=262543 RepID=B1YMF2_EXIS2|nr:MULTISPECIES: aromatic acid exporter family protein [Exiguobacterium]ACB60539.1 membrane protein-like protein [Exiguobacterium sibiricum 255-15]MDX1260059.1 aromatic acid exporter family protein [Exiguobacterium sp. K1]